ncbi:MAG: SAM-dependent methyltransferase [Candidatus Heimdallarchaeota archaeon]|nr:SAM-dependent methyltransferase [Candidatus Heimdallarchaeota archaeon]
MTSPKEQKVNDQETTVPFTARLLAYYRAQETKKETPLITDPFAAQLAGNIEAYIEKHRYFSRMDYPVVRSYYIEQKLLTPWCHTQKKSQIVLLGAGLDTRAYRFHPFEINNNTIFEVDLPIINNYKRRILKEEQPLCKLIRISTDLSKPNWKTQLLERGFSTDVPTFWVLEGLVYYLEREKAVSLLKIAAEISPKTSQMFADVCIPAYAELNFGTFTKHFKWGLGKKDVPQFFTSTGWNITCSFADDHDQGRDVGQRGLIFIHGKKK